jgi:hypothetical protein
VIAGGLFRLPAVRAAATDKIITLVSRPQMAILRSRQINDLACI